MADNKNENQSNGNTIQPVNSGRLDQTQPLPTKKRSYTLVWFTIALIVAAVLWFLYWFFYLRFHESTDDAYANGNYITLNSVISGPVVAYYADDTDRVKEGQLLVLLDSTNYRITYEKELASLAAIVLQVRQLYDTVQVDQAILDNRKTALEKARYDFQNRFNLINSGAISNEDYTHARDDLTLAEFNYKQAAYQLESAISAAGNTPIEKHPLIEQQKSVIRAAFYNLQHCSIYAPFNGWVAQRSVEVGQWVNPQSALMAIIPKDYVWVDANFKETQLTYMRIGQPATVWLDIYGSKVIYEGQVLGIASGTGSVFSLIPPQNATGNWIKIVQRLPVRIGLDPEVVKQYPLRLGLSANVNVNITNQDLPMLAPSPTFKPIAETTIFDIQMEKANQLIDQIVQENLKIRSENNGI